jgi:Single Cache domain 2
MPTAGENIAASHLEGDQPPSTRSLERAHILTKGKFIMRTFMISAASVVVLALSGSAFAQQGQLASADEAKAMLLKAVAAVKADRDVALIMFQKGEGGFKDRDLYVFCVRMSDGKTLAGPVAVPAGTDVRTLKDPTGKTFGMEQYAAYQKPEGQITEISYMFPKPGTTTPEVPKVAFVTRVGDLGCGVGYYK